MPKPKELYFRIFHRSPLAKLKVRHVVLIAVSLVMILVGTGVIEAIIKHLGNDGKSGESGKTGQWQTGELAKQQALITSDSATKVVVMAYYRGGSTLAGEMFNRNPDVFYWFEPLMAPLLSFIHHHPPEYKITPEDTYIKLKDRSFIEFPAHYVEEQCRILANILNCNLGQVDINVLSHVFTTEWSKSESLVDYKTCLHSYGHVAGKSLAHEALEKCLALATEKCKAAPIRAIKTTRLGGYALRRLMELDPSIKVIHVSRDPRGILTSSITMWHLAFVTRRIQALANRYCYRMHEDFRYLTMADELWSGSVFSLHYENLATKYRQVIPLIYDFLNLQMPPYLLTWFDVNTHAYADDGVLGTLRRNATDTAYRWRHDMPIFTQKVVNDICAEVIHDYGY